MNLSNELIGYIGVLIDMEARFTRTEQARAMQLEWVQAIESAYREAEQLERDADRMPFILKQQAG